MTARTYTPEAIEKLVKAAEAMLRGYNAPDVRANLDVALVPFTTEPSSWEAYCREVWGEKWMLDESGYETGKYTHDGYTRVWPREMEDARQAYRARYGIEPS